MPKNAVGRILVDADAAYAAAADAYLEAKRQKRLVQEYERTRNRFREAYSNQLAIEQRIADQLATVENIGILKQGAHDFVGRSADAVGLISGKNPLVSLGTTAVNQANSALQQASVSDLFSLIAGSNTGSGPGLGEQVLRDAGTAASVTSDIATLRGQAINPRLGLFGGAVGLGGLGVDLARNVEAGGLANLLRTPPPLLGSLDGLTNDELRALAGRIREGWDPGFLERFNDLSADRLADDIEAYADAREVSAETGRALSEADEPGLTREEADQRVAETREEMQEALLALEAWMSRGIEVQPTE